jgi:phage repressor protein C with HTH and peptisase S24 domain
MEDEEKKEKSFVVKDRRKFTETGETREDEVGKPEETKTGEPEKAGLETAEQKSRDKQAEEVTMPEMNFASFIFSLSTSAMYHFGDFPDPVSKKAERNLPAARQTIDIIAMLKEKTEGNLDSDEKNLIDTILFELRMRYVKEKDKG